MAGPRPAICHLIRPAQVSHPTGVARCAMITHLGDTQHAAKDVRTASRTWKGALAILDELRHPDAAAVTCAEHDRDLT
jgi:hypothetical protein